MTRSNLPAAAHQLLDALSRCSHGALDLTLPGGDRFSHRGDQPGPEVSVTIRDWALVPQIAARGNIGVGETYVAGLWDVDDLPGFIIFALLNEKSLAPYMYEQPLQQWLFRLVNYFLRRNHARGQAAANIRAHYDVGNDFYQLWLDPSMTYSAALRKTPDDDLVTAQQNKYGRILDKLGTSGGRILEIGCGWGGFAQAAVARGFSLLGLTLSPAQQAFFQNKLGDRAQARLEDYRHVQGKFDHIVSIEMFEAVGQRYWPRYFRALRERLAEGGRAVIQTITIAENTFEHYRRHSDYIRHYTFPGGMLPSKTRFRVEAEKAGLALRDMFAFGQDYAWTLRQWRENFLREQSNIRAMGYSETFLRSWHFYFAMCIGAFATTRTDVIQAELVHA